MSKQYCSGCRQEMDVRSKFKTCDACRKRSAEVRKTNRQVAKKCQATKSDGSRCTYKVDPKCGNKFCRKHISQWKTAGDGDNVKRCSSRLNCDPNKPREKAILPIDYPYNHCKNCRSHDREKSNARRNQKKRENQKLQNKNSEYRVCDKCGSGIQHKIEDMGQRRDGQYSHLCKKHFDERKEVEANREERDRKEEYKEYDKKPERKIAKKEWQEANPDKIYKYYTNHRAKKMNEDNDKYHERKNTYQKKWRKNNPEKVKKHNLEKKTKS